MTEKKNRFKQLYSGKYFAEEDIPSMTKYLRSIDFLNDSESILSLEVPGAGNMNYVLRVKTDMRSFILKQSRPWVEKYPSIDAPIDRINIEATYFQSLQGVAALEKSSPEIYYFDPDNYVMLMEDLGAIEDYTILYTDEVNISEEDIETLANYLSSLHRLLVNSFPDNMDMRRLNHEHIFHFPFKSDNGFNLNDVQMGLSELTVNEISDPDLTAQISELGKIYLESRSGALLHGDFYPGSWMKSGNSFIVIDAEFGFVGPREFDLGVFVAHMKMAKQSQIQVDLFLKQYEEQTSFDKSLVSKFAGIEILRRLLGVAQLPLQMKIEEKKTLVLEAKDWIQN